LKPVLNNVVQWMSLYENKKKNLYPDHFYIILSLAPTLFRFHRKYVYIIYIYYNTNLSRCSLISENFDEKTVNRVNLGNRYKIFFVEIISTI